MTFNIPGGRRACAQDTRNYQINMLSNILSENETMLKFYNQILPLAKQLDLSEYLPKQIADSLHQVIGIIEQLLTELMDNPGQCIPDSEMKELMEEHKNAAEELQMGVEDLQQVVPIQLPQNVDEF